MLMKTPDTSSIEGHQPLNQGIDETSSGICATENLEKAPLLHKKHKMYHDDKKPLDSGTYGNYQLDECSDKKIPLPHETYNASGTDSITETNNLKDTYDVNKSFKIDERYSIREKHEEIYSEINDINANELQPLIVEEHASCNAGSIKETEFTTNHKKTKDQQTMCKKDMWNMESLVTSIKTNLTAVSSLFGLDLFWNIHFTLGILASAFSALPYNIVPNVLPDHIVWTGGTCRDAAVVLAVIGLANMFCRYYSYIFYYHSLILIIH